MAEECVNMLMVLCTKGIGRTIRSMAEECIDGLMVLCTKGIGRTIRCMAEECIDFLTALYATTANGRLVNR